MFVRVCPLQALDAKPARSNCSEISDTTQYARLMEEWVDWMLTWSGLGTAYAERDQSDDSGLTTGAKRPDGMIYLELADHVTKLLALKIEHKPDEKTLVVRTLTTWVMQLCDELAVGFACCVHSMVSVALPVG